ncbi:hypothetical protein MJO28_015198 [Puccinia striiformis f. sp. tritici]|uniref:Pentacotripeptide-repeat region of PRORP domain-containing protein n=2 Tax=Puccinia striiformis TaxID=27350 RepID=A0A2S4UN10_9BASI|nr:hypothetical protein MJO28_015198 [Puccinia striiformis f. sp. tritici]POV98705.1 hypothetical protein PSTT_14281 [Puccinia striiformis]
MLLPKFATHISPFKLSHFANRGHQHFQNLRNTLNNLNLGSTVGQNSHTLTNSTTATGFGSAASGSSASGGAGGSKWSAGSRTNWNQQAHSRLITHANATAQEGFGSRLNEEDEEPDEFSTHYLGTIGLYNKRNRTISSRWHYEEKSLGLDGTSLQVRCKTAFLQSNKANSTEDPSDENLNQTLSPTDDTHASHNLSTANQHRARFVTRKPSRRHSIHCLLSSAPISTGLKAQARRFSTGNLAFPSLNNLADLARQRKNSTVASQSQPEPSVPENVSIIANPLPQQPDKLVATDPHQQWLQGATNLILSTDQNYYSTYYQLRKMLDSYVSFTSQPSSDVIDMLFWGMIINKPNYEPINNLLKCHQFLLRSTAFQPTPQTYSTLLSALCRRDLSNAKELEHRKNRLVNVSVNQQLNQSLPNLSLAPVSTTEDVKMITALSAEPNFSYASRLFHSLDREIIKQLQPAALENLIQCCANVDLFGPPRSEVNARFELANMAFKLLEDRQELTAESYSNFIILLGLSNKLPQAKALFESYKQSRSDPDKQHSTLYHQHQLQPPSSFSLAAPESLAVKKCQPVPVNEGSDANVLLSLMRVHLASGDSIAAVALLEESLRPTVDPSTSFKSSAEHILEVILGFIRSSDYSSASKWIKRLFNGDHASYQLDDPNRRREFMDRIVCLACEPSRGFDGTGVAYDAAMISIDQIDFQFDNKSMAALMARLRNVLNTSLVHALHQSACLSSSDTSANAAIIPKIQDSLEKACSIVCYIISKRSALLKTDAGKLEAISDLQTYGMIENIAKRVIHTCGAIKNRWISHPSEGLASLGRFSDDQLVRLMSHYSILPDIRDLQSISSELRHQSSYLTGLLTSYQNIIQPIPAPVQHESATQQLAAHQFKFALKITTPMILNNLTLVLAMQFYHLFLSAGRGNELDQHVTSINDWIILLTVGAILEIQAKEGKTIPSIQSLPTSNNQVFLEPLMVRFGEALRRNASLPVDQFDQTFEVQLLLRVISHYRLKTPDDGLFQAFLNKLQEQHPNWDSESTARFEHYIKEGDRYLSNRFGLLRDGLTTPTETASSARLDPADLTHNVDGSRSVSPLDLNASSPSQPNSSSPILPNAEDPSSTSHGIVPKTLPVPHTPYKGFNEHLSQVALSMFCSKDLNELEKLHTAVHQSTLQGHYLSADASSALIETFGRHRQLERLREMYVNAHVALASLDSGTTNDQALRSVSWSRVEDRMIIGLAYCGLLDEVSIHKNRLLQSGASPSADAYAAMIQHAHETTDDASMALGYFEEAIQNRVVPNTFLCNTIISKLSKARRSGEALEVFEYMKQSNLPRNSVTFGAIINACSKTGDELKAEELFKEMIRSKNFKPRIPPFNTMIQLFTQNVKQPNRQKVLYYYDLMVKYDLPPSDHTYNLLMQAYGLIEPCDTVAMEKVFQRACADRNVQITGAHWSTLINVKGNVSKDLEGTIKLFDQISQHPNNYQKSRRAGGELMNKLPDAICYEALFNVFLAFKRADLVPQYVERIKNEGIHMTAYVVNTLMKVYASSGQIDTARELFESLVDPPPGHPGLFNHPTPSPSPPPSSSPTTLVNTPSSNVNSSVGKIGDPIYREPSCYETIIRIEFGLGNLEQVKNLVDRLEGRGYPKAIVNRIKKLVNL